MLEETVGGLTQAQAQTVIDILAHWDGTYFHSELFFALLRAVPTLSTEVVILRMQGGQCEILLLKRPADDPYYPDQLHSGGTVERNTDYDLPRPNDMVGQFNRVKTELGGLNFAKSPQFVTIHRMRGKRSAVACCIYVAELPDNAPLPSHAGWYAVDLLGTSAMPPMAEDQLEFLAKAIAWFRENQPS